MWWRRLGVDEPDESVTCNDADWYKTWLFETLLSHFFVISSKQKKHRICLPRTRPPSTLSDLSQTSLGPLSDTDSDLSDRSQTPLGRDMPTSRITTRSL